MFFLRRLVRSVACVAIAALLAVVAIPAQAESNPRYAALIMDADTGVILHQSSADKKLHPASLVKMMTLMMAFDALAAGKLSLRDRVPVSKHAASMQPSKIGIAPGGSISVEDAIYALVTKSANDIAVALGEKLGGTESQFAAMMTRRAHEIGMTKTVYRNASGLHNPAQVSTARDQAKLARYIIKTYPQYYEYFSTRNFTYRGVSHHNHNRLMSSYKGMDGMKTGFIGPSGFNLVASAVRNDRRLIGVVFGGRTAASRNARMATLLDQGFAELGIGKDAGTVVVASAKGKVAPKPDRKPESIAQLAALHNVDPAAGAASARGLNNVAAAPAGVQIASLSPAAPIPAEQRPWAIQIGAFESRARTDGALREAMARLPDNLAGGSPFIAPLKTGEGWLFRARLGGYSKEQAIAACRLIKDCLPVAPQAF
jgi:D-alanyl-D-alanine carboxypeptidase